MTTKKLLTILSSFPGRSSGDENGLGTRLGSHWSSLWGNASPPRFYPAAVEKNREKAWEQIKLRHDLKWWTRFRIASFPGLLWGAQFSRELARLYEYSYWAQFLL